MTNFTPNVRDLSTHKRFLSRLMPLETGCWAMDGVDVSGGYRAFHSDIGTLAHRYAYSVYVGPLNESLQIDHLCRNRWCCNPLHLEQVTARVNQLRGFGASGMNARKKICVNGHPYTQESEVSGKRNRRRCGECEKDQTLKRNRMFKNTEVRLPDGSRKQFRVAR